jgi:2-methylcitrate dehydratase PrpD
MSEMYTRRLAEFCASVSYPRLPPAVIDKAKLCLLDLIANVYGSLDLAAVKGVVAQTRAQGGPERATALACGFRTGPHPAAFLNGTLAEALEAQDGLRFGGNHPGVAVIPAALAVAEDQGRDGRALIEAIVAGYEAAGRIAAAMHPHHTLAGFLPTGTCGAFGAAAAASKLLGYSAEQTLNTLGIAGYVLPLSMAEHLMAGSTAKIVQGGQAAVAGLTAAELAAAGLTGPDYVLEGSALKGGFTQITTRAEPKLSRLLDGLGEHYSIADIYFKPFTSCRHTHGGAQAALALARRERLSPEEIESVAVFTYALAQIAVGKGVTADSSFVSAQFSLPYVVAASLLDRDMGPAQLAPEKIADPALLALARKITVQADAELSARYPEFTASRVEVRLKDGRVFSEQVDVPQGDPRDPMTAADIAAKLKRFAPRREAKALELVIQRVLELDRLNHVKELAAII